MGKLQFLEARFGADSWRDKGRIPNSETTQVLNFKSNFHSMLDTEHLKEKATFSFWYGLWFFFLPSFFKTIMSFWMKQLQTHVAQKGRLSNHEKISAQKRSYITKNKIVRWEMLDNHNYTWGLQPAHKD